MKHQSPPSARGKRRRMILARTARITTRLLPALSQIVVLAIALLQHNVLFAAMAGTGALMMLSMALSEHLNAAPSSNSTADSSIQQPRHQPPLSSSADAADESAALLDACANIPSHALLSLFKLSEHFPLQKQSMDLWKHCVRWWATNSSSNTLRTELGLTIALRQSSHRQQANPHSRQQTLSSRDERHLEPWAVDIVRDGPHALVAGTTGSGKSLLLQAWCAGLALKYPPDRLHFVFLDFKGGATFTELKKLPHTVGSVSDLDLQHARRALRAIETELQKREELLSRHHASCIADLRNPPARIVIVIDEFQMLRFALPDYTERLARITAQGRSLNMNLILATQNPLKSVSADMKANLNLLICLRVKDRTQSTDLIGTSAAARITTPGLAFASTGEKLSCFRSAIASTQTVANACRAAQKFLAAVTPQASDTLCPQPLFTPPLDKVAPIRDYRNEILSCEAALPIGIEDDGTTTHLCTLDLFQGNIAVIGGQRRGKSTALAVARAIDSMRRQHRSTCVQSAYAQPSYAQSSVLPPAPPCCRPLIRLYDDADSLLDPLNSSRSQQSFREELDSKEICVIFSARSMKNVRYPEMCSTRIIFPSGDSPTDLLNGIPRAALDDWEPTDYQIPGRAILLSGAYARTIQVFAPPEEDENASK